MGVIVCSFPCFHRNWNAIGQRSSATELRFIRLMFAQSAAVCVSGKRRYAMNLNLTTNFTEKNRNNKKPDAMPPKTIRNMKWAKLLSFIIPHNTAPTHKCNHQHQLPYLHLIGFSSCFLRLMAIGLRSQVDVSLDSGCCFQFWLYIRCIVLLSFVVFVLCISWKLSGHELPAKVAAVRLSQNETQCAEDLICICDKALNTYPEGLILS